MANNETIVEREEAMVAQAEADAGLLRLMIHGDSTVSVQTDGGMVPSFAKQAVQAQEKVTSALEEVASQLAGSMTYSTTALGLAGTQNDGYFSVPSAESAEYLILYQNVAGVATERKRYPSSAGVQDVLEMVNRSSNAAPFFEVVDEVGNVGFVADNEGGFGTSSVYLHPEGVSTGTMDMGQSEGDGFQVEDADGLVIFQVGGDDESSPAGAKAKGFWGEKVGAPELLLGTADIQNCPGAGFQVADAHGFLAINVGLPGWFAATLPSSGAVLPGASSADVLIAIRNAGNLAASAAVRGEFNSEVQRFVCKYNHILMYGQSLSTGYEGWPALSKTPFGGNLMFGDSPRPTGRQNGVFVPLNGAALKPLKAVVQSLSTGAVMTDAEVSALAPGAGEEGESPEVGAVNFARKLFLQYHGVAADSGRLFVASNCGVSGRTIEQLSKGAVPDLYPRLPQAVSGVKAIATAEGASYCIPAILFMQGEYNYTGDNGGDNTKAGYKAKLKALAENWKADLAYGLAGQSSPPAIITYQTGAGYTRDINDLAIGMAQLELSQEERNWYMATPVYPYTDKGGHLDSNGYRWLGAQLGKVLHRVVTLGQNWKPLSPRRVTVHEQEILLDFHVPCPPLVFDTPYVVLAANNYTDKGFRVIDSVGVVPLSSVSIINETMVKLVLSRALAASPRVQYAAANTVNGNGNLRDSDDTVSADLYEYQAGSGQYAGANIPALVGKPYPLHNWCVAFSLTPEII